MTDDDTLLGMLSDLRPVVIHDGPAVVHPRGRMPSCRAIFEHWAPWLRQHGKVRGAEVVCFGCARWPVSEPMPKTWNGASGYLHRAHIVPHCKGGTETVENLHLLCSLCHKASEYIEVRDAYLEWAIHRAPRLAADLARLIELYEERYGEFNRAGKPFALSNLHAMVSR